MTQVCSFPIWLLTTSSITCIKLMLDWCNTTLFLHMDAESVLNQPNGNGSLHLSMLDCGVHEVVGRGSSSEIIQLGKQPSIPDSVKAANGSEYSGVCLIDGVDDAITVQEKKHPSEELDEHDCLSSDSGDLSEDYFHTKNAGLRRRKNRKVRLLTDLLGNDENMHPDQTRKVNAPCLATYDESVKIGIAYATDRPMAVPDNVRKVFKKRKRSSPSDPDGKQMDSMTPSQESGKEIVCKDGAGNASAIVDSQIEDNELARMDSQTVRKNHWAKHKEDAVICATVKKKKKNHVTEDYFHYKSGQIETKPADVMFSFGHETPASAARETSSFVIPASKNERSLLCKDKAEMSQEKCGQVSVTPPSGNTNPSGGLFMRTDSGVMHGSPPPFWFIPTSDASVENRSHVSTKSCMLPPKVDKAYATQFGLASSFHWLEGAREDSLMLRSREARHIEPKRPSRCGSDAFPSKGVRDVISKGSIHKIPKVQTEKQSHALNLENAFCYTKPQMVYNLVISSLELIDLDLLDVTWCARLVLRLGLTVSHFLMLVVQIFCLDASLCLVMTLCFCDVIRCYQTLSVYLHLSSCNIR